jgi:GAF domain-containing protein
MRATCVVPLVARGRTIGAMGAIQAESGRHYSPEDGVLLGELAQRAALALDNVRLFAEAQAALHEAEIANRAKDDFPRDARPRAAQPAGPDRHVARRDGAPLSAGGCAAAPRDRAPGRAPFAAGRRPARRLAIASGKIRLNLERLDLRTVVERALELVEPALEARARRPT